MNLPMAERQGSTGAMAKRVSEYEMVRDFFASTTVVLAVDVAFLFLFLGLITVLAGWLVLVPLAGILLMLTAGLSLQKAMGGCARRAGGFQPPAFRAGQIDRRRRDAEGLARRRPDARPLAPLFVDVCGD